MIGRWWGQALERYLAASKVNDEGRLWYVGLEGIFIPAKIRCLRPVSLLQARQLLASIFVILSGLLTKGSPKSNSNYRQEDLLVRSAKSITV